MLLTIFIYLFQKYLEKINNLMEVTDKLYNIWENQEKFEDIKEVINQIKEGQTMQWPKEKG
jgi:hypothetical protein